MTPDATRSQTLARNAGLEAAAQVADDLARRLGNPQCHGASKVAKAIRALKTAESSPRPEVRAGGAEHPQPTTREEVMLPERQENLSRRDETSPLPEVRTEGGDHPAPTRAPSQPLAGRAGMAEVSEARRRWRVRPVLAWYDLWVGAFYDRAKHRLYVFPLPCIGFYVERAP